MAWMVDATFPLIQIAHTVSDNLRLALYLVPGPPRTPLALPKSFQLSRPTDNVVFTILCARMKTNRLKVLSSPGPSLLADDLIHSTPQCSTSSWWLVGSAPPDKISECAFIYSSALDRPALLLEDVAASVAKELRHM